MCIKALKKRGEKKKLRRYKVIPRGVIFILTKVSCSGSFLRISAATGSGWTPWRSPDTLCDLIILADGNGLSSPFAVTLAGKA